ncbi:MAG TPA: hypothetical protein VKW76_13745 [Candidatus Binatia bacterium]|nr:hypothetical protein [Candidatus Binatia bacterium]
MAATRERPLWFTTRGASPWVVVGWLALLVAAAGAGAVGAGPLGPAGPVLAVAAVGWALARALPAPPACLRRYHLDDAEVTAFAPRRGVRRLPWSQVRTVVQDRHALRLRGPGFAAALPLGPLFADDVWFAALERVVPDLAGDLWTRLEDGVVPLRPEIEPAARALGWWAYAPAALAALAGGVQGVAVLLAVALAERLAALALRAQRTVTLHPGGIAFREGRGLFVPWARAQVSPTPRGLRVECDEGGAGVVSIRVPNFWAAAAVIQLRAQVGPDCPAEVHFRLRLANGGLAVVGEFDAQG